jgi:hypothetical protein
VPLWQYAAIGAVALALASAIVLLVVVLWNRHEPPHYWEQ